MSLLLGLVVVATVVVVVVVVVCCFAVGTESVGVWAFTAAPNNNKKVPAIIAVFFISFALRGLIKFRFRSVRPYPFKYYARNRFCGKNRKIFLKRAVIPGQFRK